MEDLDTFLTVLYVMVDDLCKQHQLLRPQRRGPAPKLGVSEIITLALFGQWARFSSERAFYRFVQRHLKAAFPNLPDHSQYQNLWSHLHIRSLGQQEAHHADHFLHPQK